MGVGPIRATICRIEPTSGGLPSSSSGETPSGSGGTSVLATRDSNLEPGWHSQSSARRGFRQRVLLCVGLAREESFLAHPLAAILANRKRSDASGAVQYRWFLAEAEAGAVPVSVVQQIRLDVTRTFSALPARRGTWGWPPVQNLPDEDREAVLARVLLAFECRAMGRVPCPSSSSGSSFVQKFSRRLRRSLSRRSDATNASRSEDAQSLLRSRSVLGPMESADAQEVSGSTEVRSGDVQESAHDTFHDPEAKPTYVQGYSMMAAMCLGFTGGREEEGFWLFAYLLEDILGSDFFSQYPALVGYHGDRAAAAALVAAEAPQVAGMLGPRGLAEAISALAARCLLSGFVGFLSGEPLVALWEELLEVRAERAQFPRLTLITWLAGLVCKVEAELTSTLARAPQEEVVPTFFRIVQLAARALPDGWRPKVKVTQSRLIELRQVSQVAADAYRKSQEEHHHREMHAKHVSECLSRTSAQLLDAVRYAEGMQGISVRGCVWKSVNVCESNPNPFSLAIILVSTALSPASWKRAGYLKGSAKVWFRGGDPKGRVDLGSGETVPGVDDVAYPMDASGKGLVCEPGPYTSEKLLGFAPAMRLAHVLAGRLPSSGRSAALVTAATAATAAAAYTWRISNAGSTVPQAVDAGVGLRREDAASTPTPSSSSSAPRRNAESPSSGLGNALRPHGDEVAHGPSSDVLRNSSGAHPVPSRHSGFGATAEASASSVVNSSSVTEKPQCRSSAHAPPDPLTVPASSEEVEERLAGSRVLLFMKGSPQQPRCRFSRASVEVLKSHGVQFDHVDVLEEPSLRLALKDRWPTFPQLYAEGVLLGGCDSVRDLAERGDLLDALRSSTARERVALSLLIRRVPVASQPDSRGAEEMVERGESSFASTEIAL
ncbi:unnamed protein product [Polarella glacialis]|uniref:Glutaredoxin domain-containing protein n=1 Tax=Polarella glacialis TaxID=89957 RepID=A0A813LFN4_POLGL|nr:unnamed protein product [Polarella glacialis]